MTSQEPTADAHAGDWIEVRGIPGAPSRKGEILEVLGRPGHQHFRVRWDEVHESLFYPSEGASIVHHGTHGRRR